MRSDLETLNVFLILKGTYSLECCIRKRKHQSLSFILHVLLYGKWSCHEKRRLDWDMDDLVMLKFQLITLLSLHYIPCFLKRNKGIAIKVGIKIVLNIYLKQKSLGR